jgi:hypothetical protein
VSGAPYRELARAPAEALAELGTWSRRATALGAGAVVLALLAAPVVALAMEPFSLHASLVAGLLATGAAASLFFVALVPALVCPQCERPFLRRCGRCRRD